MKPNLFYKMIAGVYDLLDVIYFRNYEKSPRKAVLESISGNEKILDLCTGTATNAIRIAKEKPNTKIIGVDLSKNMLKVASNKVKKQGIRNVKFYPMDATKLKFKQNTFDKILLSLVLHELEEDLAGQMIVEAKRVLKDEGEIIITEWEPSRQKRKRLLFMPIHYLEPKSYREFIKKDLYSYFKKYGLEIKKYEHCDYTKVITLVKQMDGR
ncbi:MAG: class I SAM-dependent methyltransferase [Lachnospiraceae bacterium]|nr:class I SAM-dependent methyltransferase [Lachnospiraceae bacterium]